MIWVDGIVPMFCGQAMVTESGERSGESGREEVGRWGLSTLLSSLEIFHWHFCYLALLPPYCLTTLPHYNLTILPPYHLTTLQPYHLTTLPSYNLTTLLPYHLTTLQPYHLTTLQPYHFTTLLPDHPTTKRKSVSERKGQWVLPFSTFQQVTVCCSVLFTPSCYHIWLWHIILLYGVLIIRPS